LSLHENLHIFLQQEKKNFEVSCLSDRELSLSWFVLLNCNWTSPFFHPIFSCTSWYLLKYFILQGWNRRAKKTSCYWWSNEEFFCGVYV
jgi:hypothetical protein